MTLFFFFNQTGLISSKYSNLLTRQGIATVDRSHVGFGTDFMPKTLSNTNCDSKISKF